MKENGGFHNPRAATKSAMPLCSCCKHTLLAFHSLQLSTHGKHGVVGVDGVSEEQKGDGLSMLPRSRKLEVTVSWLRDLAPDVSPGTCLVNKESSELQKLKANFAFDSENVWEVVAQ